MDRQPGIEVTVLRDIGWRLWDPIGLGGPEGGWPEDCADEYDRYLRTAAEMLEQGRPSDEVVEYLAQIVSDHMGLGSRSADRASCVATVEALATYVQSFRDGR